MIAAIILAAGSSSRLGEPKQNLFYKNKTLLQYAIETAVASACQPVFLVLGANSDVISVDILNKKIKVLLNNDWKEGMASSIRIAVKEIEQDMSISGVMIMLCDQPFVTSALIDDLLKEQIKTLKSIVACSYKNIIGVPALFDKSMFPELLLLKGNEGAKSIITDHPEKVATISFDLGSIDIDTMDDYNKLIS